MPLDPSIILGVKPVQIDMAQFSPINTLTTAMKFKQADQENRMNALKMQEYERTRAEEEGTRNYLTKADLSTPEGRSGLRNFGKTGLAYEKALTESETAGLAQKKTKFEVQEARRKFVAQAQRDTSQNPSDANITAYKEDLMANDLFTDAEKAQMAAGADRLLAMPVSERTAFMASQGASASELKPSVQQVNQGGQTQMLRVPAFGGAPTSVGTYADVPLPAAVQAQKKEVAKAGASNITQTTEKKYGEVFAGKMADTDIAKMTNAEKAPQLAESANRIIDLVKQGNVFTGPIADIKLNVARGLNVLGADNNEKIANTELLIAATGKSTLDAISAANLGTGQGFTDKDLRFLQGIAGGKIDFKPETLTELARLQHLAATRSAEAWNKRSTQLPKTATEGTGLSLKPIRVPPLSPSAIFATNPKTGARIQSLDGGANWTPVGGK
jgi:hypothetical protein